jgi:broad specificity phosphatase PhoE
VIVYFIRHGDKIKGNFFNPSIGQNDQPLSNFGIQQANELTTFFEKINIQRVFISDYLRTFQTIANICKLKNIVPIKSPLLNEINAGSFGRTKGEDQNKYFPEIVQLLKERTTDFKYPDGESGADVINRIKQFFTILEMEDKNTIVVSHEGWIKCLLCYLLNIMPEKRFHFYINTCSITEIEKTDSTSIWQIKRVNQINYVLTDDIAY